MLLPGSNYTPRSDVSFLGCITVVQHITKLKALIKTSYV